MEETTGQQKVLVVEDDSLLRELLVSKLNKEGFVAEGHVDSRTAYRYLDQNKPDIILLDLILPGEDGYEILTKIKSNEALEGVPVVILSNLGQLEDVEKAKEIGADDFMIKANFTLGEIIERVKEILSKGVEEGNKEW